MKLIEFIHRRPLAVIGVVIGISIFGFMVRGIIKETVRLRDRVIRIEAQTPCLNLTAAECAIKLFRALPSEQRRRLRISESTLRSLERRAPRERQALRRTDESPRPPRRRAGGDSPGGSPGDSSPQPGVTPPGSSPVPPSPQPLIRTPRITTPQIGPVDPITIDPIEVHCPPLPFIDCTEQE